MTNFSIKLKDCLKVHVSNEHVMTACQQHSDLQTTQLINSGKVKGQVTHTICHSMNRLLFIFLFHPDFIPLLL